MPESTSRWAAFPLPGIESMTCPALAIEVGPAARLRQQDHRRAGQSRLPGAVAAALAAALLEWRSDPNRTEARQP